MVPRSLRRGNRGMLESMEGEAKQGRVPKGGRPGRGAAGALAEALGRVDVRHGNWLLGEPVATRGGLYELFARDGSGRRLGEWPRSDGADVAAALEALSAGPGGLVEGPESGGEGAEHTGPPATDATVGSAPARLALAALLGIPFESSATLDRAARPGPVGELYTLAGAPRGAAPDGSAQVLRGVHRSLGGPGLDAAPQAPRVLVLVAGRDQLPQDLAQELELLAGAGIPVLLIPAEEAPLAALMALGSSNPEARRIALVHAPSTAAWHLIATDPRIGWVLARAGSGLAARAASQHVPTTRLLLRPTVEAVTYWGRPEGAWDAGPPGSSRGSQRSTAPQGTMVDLARLVTDEAPLVERLDPDDVHLATLVAELAGRATGPAALGGFSHGAAGLHIASPELFAELVERFRDALDKQHELPTWPDPDLRRAYAVAWRGAVDAGATLITGGTERKSSDGLFLAPTLLVNVPRASAWARPRQPLAQLRLVRGED